MRGRGSLTNGIPAMGVGNGVGVTTAVLQARSAVLERIPKVRMLQRMVNTNGEMGGV